MRISQRKRIVTANTIDARKLHQVALYTRTGKRRWMGGLKTLVTADLTENEMDGARSFRQGLHWSSAAVLVRVGLGNI
jgi:hypothetical protein